MEQLDDLTGKRMRIVPVTDEVKLEVHGEIVTVTDGGMGYIPEITFERDGRVSRLHRAHLQPV
jgi:hypothetical protein